MQNHHLTSASTPPKKTAARNFHAFNPISEGPADPFDLEYAEFGVRQLERLMVEVGRERRLYRRYLGEARAQRRKALRAWCAFKRYANLKSRNEHNLQLKGE